MNDLTWGLLLAVVVLLVLVEKLDLLHNLGKRGPASEAYPYRRKSQWLTAAERSFYGVLGQATGGHYAIFCKVRLEDVIYVPSKVEQRESYRNRIKSRHLDFVLCRNDTLEPLLAIELDDASHRVPSRRDRDAFLDRALRAAGLPYLRVQASHGYETRALAAHIASTLGNLDRPAA